MPARVVVRRRGADECPLQHAANLITLQKVRPPCFSSPWQQQQQWPPLRCHAARLRDYLHDHDHDHDCDCDKITTRRRRRRPTAPPPPHGHATHGCDHHRHLYGHSHGHGHDHASDCNHDRDNSNASPVTPALARPRPPTGTLAVAYSRSLSGPLAAGILGLRSTSAFALGCNASGFAVVTRSATPASSRPGQWPPQRGKAQRLRLAVFP